MNKKRILIKLSGAALKLNDSSFFDKAKITDLALQIKTLSSKYAIVIIIGGGNIWRGNMCSELNLNRNLADSMGMLATIMNSLVLCDAFNKNSIKTKVLSAVGVSSICDQFSTSAANDYLENGNVLILAGGTGNSFFTTDTCAALRAAQLDIKLILMGKNGTDGVYDKDPNKHHDARFIEKLSFKQAIDQKLSVMDSTALTMCEENKIELNVFNLNKKNSIVNTLKKSIKFTTLK